MPRFDVYDSSEGAGLLLDVQADILDGLSTRIVVPLMPLDKAPQPASRLNPVFEIGSERYVMVTQFMAAYPNSLLRARITSLASHDRDIGNALDMLFVGF